MKQIHTSRLAALFVLLVALLLAAGCSGSAPESAGTAGQTQTSAAATAVDAQSGDAETGTGTPASGTPSPDGAAAASGTPSPDGAAAATDGTTAAGSATAAQGGTTGGAVPSSDSGGASGGTTGVAVPSSDGGGASGDGEGAAAPSASIRPASPSVATPKPSTAAPKPSGGAGNAAASAEPSGSPQASPSSSPAATQSPHKDEVTLSIVGDSDTGTILAPAAVDFKKGDSVLDVLKRATRSRKMQMEYSGAGAAAYVEGIDNLYEFDKGSKSGWLFRVNGEFPGVGAGAYKLKAGDTVEWLYTLDMGKDIGKGADDKEKAS